MEHDGAIIHVFFQHRILVCTAETISPRAPRCNRIFAHFSIVSACILEHRHMQHGIFTGE